MYLPLLYIVIILQIRATAVTGYSLSCNKTEYAEAGKNVTIKCNISTDDSEKCKGDDCACEAYQSVCNDGRMNCTLTETELYLNLTQVNRDQDFNVSILTSCGILSSPVQLKVHRVEVQGVGGASPPETSNMATAAVAGIFGVIAVFILLLVLFQLVYNKHRQASSNRSRMSTI